MVEKGCIKKIIFDENTSIRRSPQVEHELKVATFDLLEENIFTLTGEQKFFSYNLHLSIVETRLKFEVFNESEKKISEFYLRSNALKRIIKDYFFICESYFEAIKSKTPSQIEVIDMGRRGVHDEGAQLLRDRLSNWVEVDDLTARRLFTLICVLNIRG